MAKKKTNIIDLSKVISEELENYTDEVINTFNREIPKVAENTVHEIEKTAPERTGKYKESWDVFTQQKNRFETTYIVRSSKYQLPHLLEYSHALRNGGRSKPQEHIFKAEEKATKELQQKLEEAIANVNVN